MVALVITIIVLIILTTAVMITFNNGGMVDKASYAVYRNNIRSMQESLQMNIQNMMLENIGFNQSNINVLEEDNNNFEQEMENAIPILSTLKNQNIKGRRYSQIVQIYGGKLYWSDTIKDSTNTQDIEIQQILTELGIEAYNVEEPEVPIPVTAEYKLENDIGNTCIIGFNIDESKKGTTEITLPNRYTGYDGNEYKIEYIRHNYKLSQISDDIVSQFPNLQKVIVPKGYTSIGYYAFWWCENLEEIVLPNTLTTISEGAFYHCISLEKINLPNKLTKIEKDAFRECYKLGNLDNGVFTIPKGVTTIEDSAFYDCTSLRTVSLPNALYSMGANVFNGCTNLQKVQFGTEGKLKTIGNLAFSGCSKLCELDNGLLTIPEGVTTINLRAFYSCTSLRTVNLPSTLQTIDSTAFYSCDSHLVINVNKKESECSETLKSNLSSMGFTVNYNQE